MFVCPKCSKQLSSKRRLEEHLVKSLPCDLTCRLCNTSFANKYRYYKHIKKDHQAKEARTLETALSRQPEMSDAGQDEEVIPYIPRRLSRQHQMKPLEIDTVPLDDFHELYKQMLRKANEDNCEININININIKPLQNEERMNRVLNSLNKGAYMSSLQTLSTSRGLEHVAVDVLDKVHADNGAPENHSICLADPSRKTAKLYSRTSDEKCGWILHQRDDCIRRLNSHTSDLLSILLESAVQKLQDACFIRNYNQKHLQNEVFEHDKIPCVTMSDASEYIMICFDREVDITGQLGYTPINVEYVSYDDLFDPGNISPDILAMLRQTIYDRKDQILGQLKNLIIDEKHLVDFLKRSRTVCLQTHAPDSLCAKSLKTLT